MIYPGKPNRISEDSEKFLAIDSDPKWIAEKKYNGWRCIVEIDEGKITLFSRHGKEFTQPLKQIRRELQGFPTGIYDGELMGPRVKGQKEELMLFDLVKVRETWLNHLTLRYRKDLLDTYVPEAESIKVVYPYSLGKINLFHLLKDEYKDVKPESRLVEGVVLKDMTGKYVMSHFKPSSELINPTWLKVLI